MILDLPFELAMVCSLSLEGELRRSFGNVGDCIFE